MNDLFSNLCLKVNELQNLIEDPFNYIYESVAIPINKIDLEREILKDKIDFQCLLLVENLKKFKIECLSNTKTEGMKNLKDVCQIYLERFKILMQRFENRNLYRNYNSNLNVLIVQIENIIKLYKLNLTKENPFKEIEFENVRLAIGNLNIVDNILYRLVFIK